MNDYIKINPKDDVIVALKPLKQGTVEEGVTLLQDVKAGHKIALFDMSKGHLLIKYGHVIGKLSKDVKKGEWIHSHNLVTSLADGEPTYHYEPETLKKGKASKRTFEGYLRYDGRAGVRDDIYIIPTVGCINNSVSLMASSFKKKHPDMEGRLKVLTHPYGCSQLGSDLGNTAHLLASLAHNPNAGAVLVVGLGCENNRLSAFMPLVSDIPSSRLISFAAQEVGDEVIYGEEQLEKLYAVVKEDKRVPLPLSMLTLGLKCGGSDGYSGITANPLAGLVSDIVGDSGGSVALTEVPEMFGAEQSLMNRAVDEPTFKKVVSLITNFKAYYAANNQPCYENPSPGNKDGGITTLEEKSNGCVLKGGDLPIVDVLDIGERISKPGLSLVNGPGNDLVASTNVAAAGATILIFTTGRGTPFGSLIPTIKVSTNDDIAIRKPNWIDFDGGAVLVKGFAPVKERLLDLLIEVASGKKVKAEASDEGLIALFKTGVTL